jgi:hypothetical protein
MNLDLGTQARAMRVGNLAGWALGVFASPPDATSQPSLTFTHLDYYAKIEAALPGDLSGGRFQIVIDALTDEHYKAVKDAPAADLFLYWQDVNAGVLGYLGNLAGVASAPSAADLAPALVARIAITGVHRRPGARAYETAIDGRDWAYHRLSTVPAPMVCYVNIAAAVRGMAEATGLSVTPEPGENAMLGADVPPEAEQTDSIGVARTCQVMLRAIADRIAEGLRKDAPSVVLLRDGAVHVGRRAIPFPAAVEPIVLDPESGLAETAKEGNGGETAAPGRWRLLCRGRPDIKPGAVVRFARPPEDVETTLPSAGLALLGSLAGFAGGAPDVPDTTIYVAEIVHRVSRTAGLQSEITGVELAKPGDPVPFDPWSAFLADADGPVGRPLRSADASSAVGKQVRDMARSVLGRIRLPEVGEVRAATASTGGVPEPPAQTVTLWEGTQGAAGQANSARRDPISRASPSERRGVATVSPFAWGQTGLVVPRYPGMRVAIAYRNGRPEDPLEIGAFWGEDARMQAQPGDWWLCLPVDAPTAALEATDTSAHLPSGKTVHDLTDAAGTRVIQVGRLTIRVGKDQLPDAGKRPEEAPGPAVTIEHADGKAGITIDAEGKITLHGKNISIDAGSDGTVSISANAVNVSVTDKMSVS